MDAAPLPNTAPLPVQGNHSFFVFFITFYLVLEPSQLTML